MLWRKAEKPGVEVNDRWLRQLLPWNTVGVVVQQLQQRPPAVAILSCKDNVSFSVTVFNQSTAKTVEIFQIPAYRAGSEVSAKCKIFIGMYTGTKYLVSS